MRKLACAALAVSLFACKKSPPPAPEVTPAASASTKPAAGLRPEAGTIDPAEEAKAKAEHAAYLEALARGRKLASQKKSKEAIAAFEEAAKHEPTNAQAWGEAGYARFLAGDLSGAEDDLEKARDCGGPPKLLAQIWFNLGLVREKEQDQAGARSAWVISRSLSPTKAVLAKIGNEPECAAEINYGLPELDLAQATSWEEAADKIGIDKTEVKPQDEGGYKNAVCTQSFSADPADWTHDACDGPPPWTPTRDHLWFTQTATVIFPGPGKNLFLSESERTGGWPAHCTGVAELTGTMDASWDVLTDSFDGHGSWALTPEDIDAGVAINPIEQGDSTCADGAGFVEESFFEHGTGRLILRVRRPVAVAAKEPEVTLVRTGSIVKLGGGACDKTFDLAALAKNAPSKDQAPSKGDAGTR